MKSLCVYCGSNPGSDPAYLKMATAFGAMLAMRGIALVYGGGKVGLMGAVAEGALSAGGRVIGVMPKSLIEKEVAHMGLTELHAVSSMHERKGLMAEMADAFVALPGGAGTLEEIFEVWTWSQLGFHQKPCAFLDTLGFYSKLVDFLKYMVDQRFTREEHYRSLIVESDPEVLMERILSYRYVVVDKWMDRKEEG